MDKVYELIISERWSRRWQNARFSPNGSALTTLGPQDPPSHSPYTEYSRIPASAVVSLQSSNVALTLNEHFSTPEVSFTLHCFILPIVLLWVIWKLMAEVDNDVRVRRVIGLPTSDSQSCKLFGLMDKCEKNTNKSHSQGQGWHIVAAPSGCTDCANGRLSATQCSLQIA